MTFNGRKRNDDKRDSAALSIGGQTQQEIVVSRMMKSHTKLTILMTNFHIFMFTLATMHLLNPSASSSLSASETFIEAEDVCCVKFIITVSTLAGTPFISHTRTCALGSSSRVEVKKRGTFRRDTPVLRCDDDEAK